MRRLLVISHSALLQKNRKKWRLLASAHPQCQWVLLVPSRWKEGEHWARAEAEPSSSGLALFQATPLLAPKLGLYTYPSLPSFVERISPDLIYLEEEPWSFIALGAVALARKRGIPTGLFTAEGKKNRHYPIFYRANLRSVSSSLHFALAETRAGAELLHHFGFTGDVPLSHLHGIDDTTFYPSPEAPPSPHAKLRVGTVARLAPEKGVHLLLQAVTRLRRHISLWIAGDGREREKLKKLAREQKIEAHFVGHLPEPELASFYRSLDLFVLPSLSTKDWAEGVNRSLLQAMASALPCIGSSCGGTAELLKGCGLLFQEGNVRALQQLIKFLGQTPRERRRLGILAHEKFQENYRIPQIASDLEKALFSSLR